MKNKIISKLNACSDIDICMHSAYEDLQLMIKDIFTNVGLIQPQLSFKELSSLFERYDWQDIIDKIEDINYNHIQCFNQMSVYELLLSSLINDKNILLLHSPLENTYYNCRKNEKDTF